MMGRGLGPIQASSGLQSLPPVQPGCANSTDRLSRARCSARRAILRGRLQALFKFDGEQRFGLTDNGDALGDEIKVVLKGFQAAFGQWGCRKGQEGTEQAGGLELGC